jgi:Cdc6-like AAA superfamily ATPase
LYGKAGCGKTVLSSTVIENVRLYCKSAGNAALAVFYFSFSDNRQQSFESLLCSLVAQLGWKEPGRSMLQREYDKPNRNLPEITMLEEILLSSTSQYDEVFLALDALDECPESEGARRNMLDGLERLSEKASNLRIFATSRELRDIRQCMDSLEAEVVTISSRPVDADIGRYVAGELSRDRKLSRLDEDTKTLIMETFARNADGM